MNGFEFEKEVLRVARHLWKRDLSGGPEFVDGRERDAIFFEDDVTHLVEMTIDRSEEKAKKDCRKLSKLAGDMRKSHPERVIKCWFVVKEEPTDRQRAVARAANYPIHCVCFKDFQAKLIDAKEYLSARGNHAFGSVYNPSSNSFGDVTYIPLDVKERLGDKLWSLRDVADGVSSGRRVVLTADFGAGKSMTLREAHLRLADIYLQGRSSSFPVHINLREHIGAVFPDEILERHARIIGFPDPARLVRAWRAGYVHLIIDGFDEITSLGFQGRWRKLRDLRYKALAAVRELIGQQPSSAGILIAGREHYFDSYGELIQSLGLSHHVELTLNEFTESQVASLLHKLSPQRAVALPEWLPRRPLFVATLALKGYFSDASLNISDTPGIGWNDLISAVCRREARIASTLDPDTIRKVLERVATFARCREGNASVGKEELVSGFVEVCGYEPDEQGLLLLERLPGLGVSSSGDERRAFMDGDLSDALGAGDLAAYFLEPWSDPGKLRETVNPLSATGVEVAKAILTVDPRSKHAGSAIERAAGFHCLTFDVMQVARHIGSALETSIVVRDLHIRELSVAEECNEEIVVYLSDCIIDSLDVDPNSKFAEKVRLQGCLISELDGVSSLSELPQSFIDANCVVERLCASTDSSNAILALDTPLPVRVLLVVLRKLFFQRGSGRRRNAFFRGLDVNAQRYVDDILSVIQSHNIARQERKDSGPVFYPIRSERARVSAILSQPSTTVDEIVMRVRALA